MPEPSRQRAGRCSPIYVYWFQTTYCSTPGCCARMKPDAMILHPLPRTVEIDPAVDDDPRALYFTQAANGLFVRMALLTMLWDASRQPSTRYRCHVMQTTVARSQDFIELEEQYGAHNYHPLDVVIERAEGVWVWDVEGKQVPGLPGRLLGGQPGPLPSAHPGGAARAGASGSRSPRARSATTSCRCSTRTCTS